MLKSRDGEMMKQRLLNVHKWKMKNVIERGGVERMHRDSQMRNESTIICENGIMSEMGGIMKHDSDC